jgi:hypothetical protein
MSEMILGEIVPGEAVLKRNGFDEAVQGLVI